MCVWIFCNEVLKAHNQNLWSKIKKKTRTDARDESNNKWLRVVLRLGQKQEMSPIINGQELNLRYIVKEDWDKRKRQVQQ